MALAVGDVPPAPVQVTVYVVFVVGETVTEPEVAVPAVKFFVHEVAFVDDQVIVELEPLVIEVGFAEIEAVGAGVPADTVTAVHAPQLSDSLDSVIVPVEAAEFLSAQARTYHVAADGNVYESVAAKFVPFVSAEERT